MRSPVTNTTASGIPDPVSDSFHTEIVPEAYRPGRAIGEASSGPDDFAIQDGIASYLAEINDHSSPDALIAAAPSFFSDLGVTQADWGDFQARFPEAASYVVTTALKIAQALINRDGMLAAAVFLRPLIQAEKDGRPYGIRMDRELIRKSRALDCDFRVYHETEAEDLRAKLALDLAYSLGLERRALTLAETAGRGVCYDVERDADVYRQEGDEAGAGVEPRVALNRPSLLNPPKPFVPDPEPAPAIPEVLVPEGPPQKIVEDGFDILAPILVDVSGSMYGNYSFLNERVSQVIDHLYANVPVGGQLKISLYIYVDGYTYPIFDWVAQTKESAGGVATRLKQKSGWGIAGITGNAGINDNQSRETVWEALRRVADDGELVVWNADVDDLKNVVVLTDGELFGEDNIAVAQPADVFARLRERDILFSPVMDYSGGMWNMTQETGALAPALAGSRGEEVLGKYLASLGKSARIRAALANLKHPDNQIARAEIARAVDWVLRAHDGKTGLKAQIAANSARVNQSHGEPTLFTDLFDARSGNVAAIGRVREYAAHLKY